MSADTSKTPWETKKRIFRAAEEGRAEEIRSLLQDLPSGEVTDTLHQCTGFALYEWHTAIFTPLSIAAHRGHMEVVQILVEEHSMSIDHKNNELPLMPALHAAVLGNQMDIVQYLISRGCDVNLTNSDGETALFIACREMNLAIAGCLQQNGASLDISDKEGFTCLMRACCTRNDSTAQWLLSSKADVNLRNKNNQTALHLAAGYDNDSFPQLLLNHGAAMLEDINGFTPVVCAAVDGFCRVIECFANSPKVSKEDKIQGLELLGSMTLDMVRAYSFLHRAMKERYSDPNHEVPKAVSPLPVHSHLQESASLEELETRKSDHDLLQLECWATMRRILGFNRLSAWRVYKDFALRLKDDEQFQFTISLLLQFAESGDNPSWTVLSLYTEWFLDISKDAFSDDTVLSFTDFKTIVVFIIRKLHESKDNHEALPMTSNRLRSMCLERLHECLYQDPDLGEGSPWMELAENFAHLLSLLQQKHILLQGAIKLIWCKKMRNKEEGPYALALVDVLLQFGADLNGRDQFGMTPLHWVAVLSANEKNQRCLNMLVSIARTLLRAGALPAVHYNEGMTALDLAASSPVRDVLLEFLPPSLQSLAAVAILKHNIPFQSELSASQAAFVQLH